MRSRIVLLGPPASGKGTQAEMIQAKYQLPVFSLGALLRNEMRAGTALGVVANEFSRLGKLVPDGIVTDLVRNWLCDKNEGFVFDGYPRSLGQAHGLEQVLKMGKSPLDIVLAITLDESAVSERMQSRRVCSECGLVASVGLLGPRVDSACPRCGGVLEMRADDTSEALARRMHEYAETTIPVISYYRDSGLLRTVDGTPLPDSIFRRIAEILETK